MKRQSPLLKYSGSQTVGIVAENLFINIYGKDPYLQVQAIADFGLGSEDYELVEVFCKPKADGSTEPRAFGH